MGYLEDVFFFKTLNILFPTDHYSDTLYGRLFFYVKYFFSVNTEQTKMHLQIAWYNRKCIIEVETNYYSTHYVTTITSAYACLTYMIVYKWLIGLF